MGFETVFIVALRDHAALIDFDPAAGNDFKPDATADHRGIGPVELAMLWALLEGASWNTEMLEQFTYILCRREGRCLLHKLPAAMVEKLANLPAEHFESTVAAWATSDEISRDASSLRPVLEDLHVLAQLAMNKGRSLFVWNCS